MVPRSKTTEQPPLVYLDTCVYIDLIVDDAKPHPETGERRGLVAKRMFDAVNDGRIRLAHSYLTEAEVFCAGYKRANRTHVQHMMRGWFDDPEIPPAEIHHFVSEDAIELAQDMVVNGWCKKPSGADALHLACAVHLSCDWLMTYDERFPHGQTVRGVKVSYPTVVWQKNLFD